MSKHTSYCIWFGVYVFFSWIMLGATWQSFLIVIGVYAVSVGIALSPMGERILRFSEGARKPATRKEREYLLPIFQSVYDDAKKEDEGLSEEIEVFISNKVVINAFAMGRKTVCVTRGAMEVFTPEQLKGIIAHELGHIANGDTIAGLLHVVGNGIFTLLMLSIRIVFFMLDVMSGMTSVSKGLSDLGIISKLSRLLFDFMLFLFMSLGQVILSANRRKSERMADRFACDIGYGEQLMDALNLLQKISFTKKMTLMERLKQSHPYIEDRIGRLENWSKFGI